MSDVHGVYQAYLEALRAGSRRRAFEVVAEAREAGHDIETLYLDVFQTAMHEVGRLWQMNEMTVAQEHLATAITQGAMALLYDELFDRDAADGSDRPLLIGACAPNERHEIGLRMLCDLLELRGWDTIFLGATVPDDALAAMVDERKADVLALSASTSPQVSDLATTIRFVRQRTKSAPFVIVGGRAFSDDAELPKRIGADAAAADAREAAALLDTAVSGR